MRRAVFLLAALTILGGCASRAEQAFGPQLDRARQAGSPVLIYALGVPGQIQTWGNLTAVPVYIQFVVTAGQTIRTIRFVLAAYSPRGLPIRTRTGKHLRMELIGPGPFTPHGNYEVNSFNSRPAGFPGGDVTCVELTRMLVTYADGRQAAYRPGDIAPTLMPALRHGCDDQGPLVSRMLGGP